MEFLSYFSNVFTFTNLLILVRSRSSKREKYTIFANKGAIEILFTGL